MKILIIEDEDHAASHLRTLLGACTDEADVVGVIDSIEEAVRVLATGPPLDLIFLDIYLADGIAFEIFEQMSIDTPIIFTTAYDNYAIQAFDVNSIDYLLKPIRKDALQKALAKFNRLEQHRRHGVDSRILDHLASLLRESPNYQKSFLISYGDRLLPVLADDFAYFEIKNGVVRGVTFENKHFIMDETLQELEDQLNPTMFYRANRQVIVNYRAIVEVTYYFNGRLLVGVKPPSENKVLISKARASAFKNWIRGR
ncbi:LytTR family DNA-binding domain-containing protein [Rhodocaloribacter litoris]|uniref:LytR/AlgR family response regulator transcription factor n=1 Tax=Rhodocaloribacter litoris TaxID=2558931 RepID=UPI0014218495|nr:LytTR family DNA-binding domain-containing protein [Rhodocaloribacter litoris]QXD14133.1 LytTR family DNA-binding domain-containing protein [Rhodocaloribacter litoris]